MTTGTLPTAEDIFGLAVNASLHIEMPVERVNGQLKIVDALNKSGLSAYARSLLPGITQQLQKLENTQERSYLLLLLIRQQCGMKLLDEAEKTLLSLESGDSRYTSAVFDIASVLAKSGEVHRALELANAIEDLDDYESILELCGIYYAGLCRFNEAGLTAVRIEAPLPRLRLLLALVAEQWNSGMHDETLQTLRTVQTIADGITEENVRNEIYLQLIDSLLAVQQVIDALTVSKKVSEFENIAAALCKTIPFFHQSGNVSGLHAALSEALAAARKVADISKKIDTLKLVGEAFRRTGETDTAKEVFQECFSVICIINNGYAKVRRQIEFAENMFSLGIVNAAEKVLRMAASQVFHIDEKTFLLLSLSEIVQKQSEYLLTDSIPQTIQQIEEFRQEGFDKDIEEGIYERVISLAEFDYGLALFRSDDEKIRQEGIKRIHTALESMQKISDPLNQMMSFLGAAERGIGLEILR
ncbi:MAG: hypothetical protein FWE67_14595 [Planctomycetaceae bacterium]|nr:hypothetical protein [Planctomycetaceae bacterium]